MGPSLSYYSLVFMVRTEWRDVWEGSGAHLREFSAPQKMSSKRRHSPENEMLSKRRQIPESQMLPSEALAYWEKHDGPLLEPLLMSGAIALLDARWIVQHAEEVGACIRRRQDLRPAAFLAIAALKFAGQPGGSYGKFPYQGLRVVAISYPWLHPVHPDPRGHWLRKLALVLKAYLDNEARHGTPQVWGVFWDFGSLHQHPQDGRRTASEDVLFEEGLSGLETLYGNQHTHVFRLTAMPHDYPAAYELPEGANCTVYADRGWCFTEWCWASMAKSFTKSLDLGKLQGDEDSKEAIIRACKANGGRLPPLTPDHFAAEIESKTFTNGLEDRPLVVRLYKASFDAAFTRARELHYSELQWSDAEAEQCCAA